MDVLTQPLNIEFRPYQVELAEKICTLVRQYGLAYLAAEVRTGKTLTSLLAAQMMGKRKVFFVTKKDAISSIEADYKTGRFDFMIKVINHKSAHKFMDDYDLVICDENHAVGAFPKPSQRWETMRDICIGKDLILLSGTPNPESYSQLFHQFNLSTRSPWIKYRNFYQWVRAGYVDVKKKKINGMDFNDYSGAKKEMVLKDVQHLMISFSQKDAGFSLEVEEKIMYVQMQKRTYDVAALLRKNKIVQSSDNSRTILADTPVKMQGKLHQIYSGTVKTEEKQYIVLDESKALFIKREFAGKKIAIFYKFIAEGKMLEAILSRLTTSPEEFNATGPEVIYYRQYLSGREGTNLSSADYLIFLNLDFSAVSYIQSRQRMMTRDREKQAVAIYLFSVGGIEEKIYKVLQNKEDYTLYYFMKDFGIRRGEFKNA